MRKLEDKLSKYLANPNQLSKIDYLDHPSNYFYHHNSGEYGFFLQGEDYIEKTALVHNNSTYQMKLPQGLQSFLSFYPILFYEEKKQHRLEFTLDIPIILEMKYKDLSNKIRTQLLNVKIWIYMVGGFGMDKENVVLGRFEFI